MPENEDHDVPAAKSPSSRRNSSTDNSDRETACTLLPDICPLESHDPLEHYLIIASHHANLFIAYIGRI